MDPKNPVFAFVYTPYLVLIIMCPAMIVITPLLKAHYFRPLLEPVAYGRCWCCKIWRSQSSRIFHVFFPPGINRFDKHTSWVGIRMRGWVRSTRPYLDPTRKYFQARKNLQYAEQPTPVKHPCHQIVRRAPKRPHRKRPRPRG